jgi:hypothetical protein
MGVSGWGVVQALNEKSPIADRALNACGDLFSGGHDAHGATLLGALDGELHGAFGQREQGVILADADVFARVEFGAALANDDVAGEDELAAVALDAQAFAF